jgi:hypothetical protein
VKGQADPDIYEEKETWVVFFPPIVTDLAVLALGVELWLTPLTQAV